MEFSASKSIYLQIADFILEKILKEDWKEQERIPSVKELAVVLQVNPNTIMKTYTYLQKMDVITMKRGIGYFVSQGAKETAKSTKILEFKEETLPVILKAMEFLDISLNDLEIMIKDIQGNKR